jgi:hypothetical protein
MKTAKVLTSIVAGSKADRGNFKGVSDHTPHAQRFTFPDGFSFVLATFNVMNPAYLFYQNGIPLEGKPLPDWLKMEDQAGLENIPSSDPLRQDDRENYIFHSILNFIEAHDKLVLCLQECWPWLESRLQDFARRTPFDVFAEDARAVGNAKSFRVTIVRGIENYEMADVPGTAIRIGEGIVVCNVHMAFKTEDTISQVKACLTIPGDYRFVVGDFNVQTQYLSLAVLDEDVCKETLVEFVPRFNQPLFAVHPRGWTNWNVCKNCADREKNWDHFDNIMLSRDPYRKLEVPAVEPVHWEITME